MTGIIIATIKL